MGSVKRKALEEAQEDHGTPPLKQQRENGLIGMSDEPVACLHDVSYPVGYVAPPSGSTSTKQEDSKPAKEFPFTLDPFQSEAIKCLDNGESVMVCSFYRRGLARVVPRWGNVDCGQRFCSLRVLCVVGHFSYRKNKLFFLLSSTRNVLVVLNCLFAMRDRGVSVLFYFLHGFLKGHFSMECN